MIIFILLCCAKFCAGYWVFRDEKKENWKSQKDLELQIMMRTIKKDAEQEEELVG